MQKKIALVLSVAAGMYLYGQDVSAIRNVAEVYSNSPITGSAKYTAMAGSVGALGGDLSGINVNPAGLGVYITGDVQATLGINNNKNSSTLAGVTKDYKVNNTDFSQVGGVMSFDTDRGSSWKFVNVGFNYVEQNVEGVISTPGNHNIIDPYKTSATTYDNHMFDGHSYDRSGRISKSNIAVGANYDNQFYFGAALNLHTASITQYDTYWNVAASNKATWQYDKQNSPYTDTSTGTSFSIGAIGKIGNNVRLGVALDSPTWWNIDTDYTEYGYDNNGNFYRATNSDKTSLTSPMKITVSGAIIANKNFSLNVDYIQGVTKPKFTGTSSDYTKQLNEFLSNSYRNTSEIRVGGEYRIMGFRLRGGYAYTSNPYKAGTLSTYNDNGSKNTTVNHLYITGNRYVISGGLGYDWKSFYIDAAYQNITSHFLNPFYGGIYGSANMQDGVENTTSIVSDVKNTQNVFFITLGFKF